MTTQQVKNELTDRQALAVTMFGESRKERLIGQHAVAWVVRGERRLQGRPGALLSLFALGGPARIRTDGLEYPLADELVEPGSSRGVSNVFLAEAATVRVTEGVVLALWSGAAS